MSVGYANDPRLLALRTITIRLVVSAANIDGVALLCIDTDSAVALTGTIGLFAKLVGAAIIKFVETYSADPRGNCGFIAIA